MLKEDLQISKLARDTVFTNGMEQDGALKDPPTWDPLFKNQPFHGVVLVAGDSQTNVTKTLNNISTGLMKNNGASQAGTTVVGDVRPGRMRGFEQWVSVLLNRHNVQ